MHKPRRSRFDPEALIDQAYAIMPGAIIALVIGAVAHRFLAEWLPVSGLLIAILLGMLLRTLGWVPSWSEVGLRWAGSTLLRIGIVLLGFRLALADILGLGAEVLVIVLVTVVVTFAGMRLLAPVTRTDPTTAQLLATGTAICGASAVAAASSVLDRGDGKDRQGSDLGGPAGTALAVVTLCGTVAMLALPGVAAWLNLGQREAGVWIGASVHEVSQVVAAGGLVGATALAVATVVKLARVLLLAPAVVAVRISGVGSSGGDSEQGRGVRAALLMPWFVGAFLAAVVLNSFAQIPAETTDFISQVATMLLTIAMAAVGTSVNLRTVLTTGGPALILGILGSVLAAGTALAGVVVLV